MRPEGVAEMVSMPSIHSIGNNYLEIIKDLRLTRVRLMTTVTVVANPTSVGSQYTASQQQVGN